ncbi:MFS transporter permease [Pelobium manganitolerans]|uniref:MFS transporter permease n=1 Tax=Pelobium manganitolerans TaxID=1842495 RepID=A0A419S4B4_9SPHI|nr:MFS transporter [Pelobium manganitolerans]RKD14509.1 MFS transporter permease [Pelobium manganitolerans]
MYLKNNKKTIRAWAMFDWANSAYNLVITSTIFPAYYTAITSTTVHGHSTDKVQFFGFSFVNTALSNYALAVAYLIIALITPLLTATADYRGNKRIFMKLFTWLGALACCGLYFFKLETLELGVILFALAAIGYCGGIVFNNSYLPDIATPDQQDRVSAKGFAYGYIGSVLLQIICFVFVLKPDLFGITDASFPARLSFLLVGIWWIAFAYIPFSVLPKGSPNYNKIAKSKIASGYDELRKVWSRLSEMPVLKTFLVAYFFYAMGVQTIMLVAANFGEKILHLGTSKLIATILIIQLVAILGAYAMSRLSQVFGNIKVLLFVVFIWICTCICAYFIQNEFQFYALAAVVGLIMGGIQSLSRSTFSKFLPLDTPDTASYFSFYDVTEKLAIVAGLFSFGFIEELTGNMRNSAVALALFFVIGFVMLFVTRSKEVGLAKR